jgi:hypothetical protein
MITDDQIKKAVDAVMVMVQQCQPDASELVALRAVIDAVFTAIIDLKVGDLKAHEPEEVKIRTEPDGPGLWWVWTSEGWAPAHVSEREFRARIGIHAYPHWIKLPLPAVVP